MSHSNGFANHIYFYNMSTLFFLGRPHAHPGASLGRNRGAPGQDSAQAGIFDAP